MTWLLMLLFLTALFTLALTSKYKEDLIKAKKDLVAEKELSLEKEAAIQQKLYQVVLDSNEKINSLEEIIKMQRN